MEDFDLGQGVEDVKGSDLGGGAVGSNLLNELSMVEELDLRLDLKSFQPGRGGHRF